MKTLTQREAQLARLVRQGKMNKEIAPAMGITEGTVKEYLSKVYRKLGLRNRTQFAIWASTNLPA